MRTTASRLLALGAIALATTVGLSACGSDTPTTQETPEGAASSAPSGEATSHLPQGPYTINTNEGEVELEAFPERIVTLDLTALDVIDSLGLGQYVVGTAGAQGRLPEFVNKYEVIPGGQREPDYEMIAGLEPDLIIGGDRNIERDPKIKATLEGIAPTVNMGVDFTGFDKNNNAQVVRNVASIFGEEALAKAEEQLKRLDERAAAIASKAQGTPEAKALVVMTTGGKINLFGPGSRWGLPFSDLGFEEAVEVQASGPRNSQEASFELIADANPATMFVLDRDVAIGQDGADASTTLENDLVMSTDAAKNDRIFQLNPSYWLLVNGGLNSFGKMLDDVEQALA